MNRLLLAARAMMALAAMPMMASSVDVALDGDPDPIRQPDGLRKRHKPPKPQVVRLPDQRQVPAEKSSSLKRLLAQKGRK